MQLERAGDLRILSQFGGRVTQDIISPFDINLVNWTVEKAIFGYPPSTSGRWHGLVRIVHVSVHWFPLGLIAAQASIADKGIGGTAAVQEVP
jgi:hypothetical protein